MGHRWQLRADPPRGLVRPCRVDPAGVTGPTRAQTRLVSWRRAAPGFWVPASVDPAWPVEQRILEASCRLPVTGAVSGWAALRMAGGNLFDGSADGRDQLPVDLVVAPPDDLRAGPGVRRHRAALPPTDVVVRHGVPCTTVERALLDLASWTGDLTAVVVAFDLALSAGLTGFDRLEAFLASPSPGARGLARARSALSLAEDRVLSPRETPVRLIGLRDLRLPPVRCNWPVADGRGVRIGRPDLLCEELAVVGEYDGAEHRSRARQAHDVTTEDAYRNAGLECFRLVGQDFRNKDVVRARILGAVRRAAASAAPRTFMLATDPGRLC